MLAIERAQTRGDYQLSGGSRCVKFLTTELAELTENANKLSDHSTLYIFFSVSSVVKIYLFLGFS